VSTRAERAARFAEIDIYPVTCEALSAGRSDAEVLEGLAEGGARIVQLRDKAAPPRVLYDKALHFRHVTRAHGMLLIINDHIDIAMAVDADGVHLGCEDFPLEAARHLMPDRIIGASTHNVGEAKLATSLDVDYINIGPIFATKTKDGLHEFLGPAAIAEISAHTHLPFTVMGGINADNIDDVVAAGARRIAMVTALTKAPDIAAATRRMRERITQK
jgi:thiamine-phosphate pyrophosphorylase